MGQKETDEFRYHMQGSGVPMHGEDNEAMTAWCL